MNKKINVYSNILAWGLLLFLIGNYVFGIAGWRTPTEDPPGGNIVLETGANPAGGTGYIQFNNDGDLGADSNLFWDNSNKRLGIGTTTPSAKLEVIGQIKITGGSPGDNKVLTSNASGLASWEAIDSGGACVVSGNDIICSGIPASSAGSLSITKNEETCPIWKDCDGDGHTYGSGDCDESCSACYVGSSEGSFFSNGKDEDCDEAVDETTSAQNSYVLYVTQTKYTGNLGGRAGADTKCNSDGNKPSLCVGDAWAFISVNVDDEVCDLPTTKSVNTSYPWYWLNESASMDATVASNWVDLLDGTINHNASDEGFNSSYKTGCKNAGGEVGSNCTGWTSDSGTLYWGHPQRTDHYWLNEPSGPCSTNGYILCSCLVNSELYY